MIENREIKTEEEKKAPEKGGRLKKYAITFSVGIALALVFLLTNDAFSASLSGRERFTIFSNAFTMIGLFMVCIGMIYFVSGHGMFDGLGYGFKSIGRAVSNKKDDDPEEAYDEYKKRKARGRRKGTFILITGAVFFAVGGILYIIFRAKFG